MSLVGLVALQLAALVGLAAAAAGLGEPLLRRLGGPGPAERLAWSTVLGLGLAATLLVAVAAVGGLRRGVVLALAAGAVGLLAAATARGERRNRGTDPAPGTPAEELPAAGSSRSRTSGLARRRPVWLAAALLPALAWSLYPPTAFDATVYHLPTARAFAESHRLVVLPELLFPVFPHLAEVLFAALLAATGSDTTAALVQWLAVAATAVGLAGAASRLYSRRAGLWAAALWLAHPLVHYQAASAYVDATLAAFALLAVVGWELWKERGDPGWIAVAGVAAGCAASTKYLGLLWLALLAALTLVAGPRGRRLRGLGIFLACAVAVAAPWTLRIHAATGNPVHPFLAPVFEGGEASGLDRQLGLADDASSADVVGLVVGRAADVLRRPGELAAFAWRAAFVPRAFDRQAPLAPWALGLVPLALLHCRRDPRLLRWLLLAGAYAVFWTTSQPRFQLPGAALLALVGAGTLEHLARRASAVGRLLGSRRAAGALALVLVAPGPLYAGVKLARLGGLPPADPAARANHLDRQVRGHAALRHLEARRGSDYTLYAAFAPDLTYFAAGRFLGQARGPYRFGRIRGSLDDADALWHELRAMEVDHLLVVGVVRFLPEDEEFARRFEPLYADAGCTLYALRLR